jgi:protein-S-isoprenylcysteine O-methyltransferase Ste14
MTTAWLILRSVFWTAVLPGFFAGYLPWRLGLSRAVVDSSRPTTWIGLPLIVLGALVLATCIIEFARSGRGTLSPLDPPRTLVVRGLYRYVRNPMYVGVTTIVLGEALLAGSRTLAVYSMMWFAGVNLVVIGYEEPTLQETFGESYAGYRRRVRRWLPAMPPRDAR